MSDSPLLKNQQLIILYKSLKIIQWYSETSKRRTSWDQPDLSFIVLNREVSSFQRLKLH